MHIHESSVLEEGAELLGGNNVICIHHDYGHYACMAVFEDLGLEIVKKLLPRIWTLNPLIA